MFKSAAGAASGKNDFTFFGNFKIQIATLEFADPTENAEEDSDTTLMILTYLKTLTGKALLNKRWMKAKRLEVLKNTDLWLLYGRLDQSRNMPTSEAIKTSRHVVPEMVMPAVRHDHDWCFYDVLMNHIHWFPLRFL